MMDRLSWAWVQATSCCDGKIEMTRQQQHRNGVSHFIGLFTKFVSGIVRQDLHAFFHKISKVCRLYLESMQQSNHFNKHWCDHSMGFSRNSWEIFNKKGIIWYHWRHTLQHYSSTFLCHTVFIPDRSCLDVPVGKKCSACNGLDPELLHQLQYLSEAFSPSLPVNSSKTPTLWGTRPCGKWMYENTNQVFVVFADVIL